MTTKDIPADDERIYPCADCGTLRSKAEGGTTFTVCDECWDKRSEELDKTATLTARCKELEAALEQIRDHYRLRNLECKYCGDAATIAGKALLDV